MNHLYCLFIFCIILSACSIDYSKVTTIYISNDIINELNNKFETETLEYVYCLYGTNYKDGILLNEIKEAIYLDRKPDTYSIDTCYNNDKVIGYLHQHMNGLCYLGPGDSIDGIEAIQCGKNKIVIFSKEKSLKIINIDNNNDMTIHLDDKDFCPINTNYCRGTCYPECLSNEVWVCDETYAYCK